MPFMIQEITNGTDQRRLVPEVGFLDVGKGGLDPGNHVRSKTVPWDIECLQPGHFCNLLSALIGQGVGASEH